MSNKAPTLFDDFFFNDEPISKPNHPSKSSGKKKKASEVPLMFDAIDEENTQIDNSNPIDPIDNSSSNDKLLVADTSEDLILDEISNEEEIVEEKNTEIEDNSIISNDSIEFIQSDSAEEIQDSSEETFENASEQIVDTVVSKSNDDLTVLGQQYIEEIDYFSRFDAGIIKDNPIQKSNDIVEDNIEELENTQVNDQVNNSENISEVESELEFEDDFNTYAPQEWNLSKQYYTIGEVAQMFEVNISLIRFWSNEFKLKPRTNKKGNRYYTQEQIQTLQLIHYLVKEKKHTIKGAQEKLKTHKKLIQKNILLKDSLIDLKSKLEELKNSF